MKSAAVLARAAPISVALGVLVAACASPVRVEFDEAADFSRYRTWSWLPYEAPNVRAAAGDPEILYARLAEVVEAELAARGLVRVDGTPDVYLAYRLLVQRKEVAYTRVLPERMVPTFSNISGSHTVQPIERGVRVLETGDLVIGFVDPRGGRVVWTGALARSTPDRFESHVKDAVVRVLAGYPPPARRARPERPGRPLLLAQRLRAPLDAGADESALP
jgi:hypothetical protein